MKLRKRLIFLSVLIGCAMLVILVPALLSYSRDIRNELSSSYGIPPEPEPNLNVINDTTAHANLFSNMNVPFYWIQLQQSYSQRSSQQTLSMIRQLGLPAFLISADSQRKIFYLGVGPFILQSEVFHAMALLNEKHIEKGVIMKHIPSFEYLSY